MNNETLIEIFVKANHANKAFVNSTGSIEFVCPVAFSVWYQTCERVRYNNEKLYRDSLAQIRKMFSK